METVRTLGLILWPFVVVEANSGAIPNALQKSAPTNPTSHLQPSAHIQTPEEDPGLLPGISHGEGPPTPTDPKLRRGDLLLGMNAAGTVMRQCVHLSDTAPAVVIPWNV